MFDLLEGLAWQRRYQRKAQEPLKTWLATPQPDSGTVLSELEFIAIDLEMTGLNSETDQIISMGWVSFTTRCISLRSARHFRVRATTSVGQSAAIHHILDDELPAGEPLAQVLSEFFTASIGKVLVFHHANLDMAFLNRACKRLFNAPLVCKIIDTQKVEEKRRLRRAGYIKPQDLRLSQLRQHYNLPPYRAHNALTDALATAELLLAQIQNIGSPEQIALKTL